MFERFTDRARKVMALANQEAQRFNHEYIGTEHILLGLVKEGSGVAANVLKNLDVDLKKLRLEIEKLVKSGPDMVTMGKLQQTPRAKKVIEFAIEEARSLNHNYRGNRAHSAGVLRETEGIAAQVLIESRTEARRRAPGVLNLLGRAWKITPIHPWAENESICFTAAKSKSKTLPSTVSAGLNGIGGQRGNWTGHRPDDRDRASRADPLPADQSNNPVLPRRGRRRQDAAIVEGMPSGITGHKCSEILKDKAAGRAGLLP